jgi:hypothetical protein
MNTQFSYIAALGKQYAEYIERPTLLFDALNALSETVLKDIVDDYGDPEKRFQPVNLLRAETARQILLGVKVSESFVEETKEKIRTKQTQYF